MTIKEFAKLVGCNPQTLRYYDHENLLKPVKVDEWTGYRYYDENQAVTFVKIKNLQKAGFKIDEVKALLNKDDRAIYEAFDRKIKEEEARLQEIKDIQKSYRTEMEDIMEKIKEYESRIANEVANLDFKAEFGEDYEKFEALGKKVAHFFDVDLNNIEEIHIEKYHEDDEEEIEIEEPEYQDIINNPDWEVLFEKHGWKYVKDFINDIGPLPAGEEYFVKMAFNKDKIANAMSLQSLILSDLSDRIAGNGGKKGAGDTKMIGTEITNSEDTGDGKNHFWLVRKRK